MRMLWMWLLLSLKRLCRKPLYVLLVLLLPVVTLCYTTAVQEEQGVAGIALAVPENADSLAQQVVARLAEKDGLVRFVQVSPTEARHMVQTGQVDGAWVFPYDMTEKLAAYLADGTTEVVRVLQREENVLLRLSRELLGGAVYDCCVEPVYIRYLRQQEAAFAELTDAQLVEYMALFRGNTQLFAFETLDGRAVRTENYLTAPLQGLFGLLILLCALAGTLYFLQDKRAGRFQAVPGRFLGWVEFVSVLAAVIGVGFAAVVCLALCGLGENLLQLAVLTIEYILCCTAFACLLGRLCGKAEVLAGVLTAISVAALVVCPIFLDLRQLGVLQWLLLPTWYIRGMQESVNLMTMPVYGLACWLGCMGIGLIRNKSKSTA